MLRYSSTLSVADFGEKLTTWYQNSFFADVVAFFDRLLFLAVEDRYENFDLGGTGVVRLRGILVGLAIGILIASFGAFSYKRVRGGLIRSMLALGASSPESAKTFAQLGCKRTRWFLREWKRRTSFSRLISPVLGEGETLDEKKDLSDVRFYLPEENRISAEVRFKDGKGSGWLSFLLTVIFTVLFLILALQYLPVLLSLADGLLSLF